MQFPSMLYTDIYTNAPQTNPNNKTKENQKTTKLKCSDFFHSILFYCRNRNICSSNNKSYQIIMTKKNHLKTNEWVSISASALPLPLYVNETTIICRIQIHKQSYIYNILINTFMNLYITHS